MQIKLVSLEDGITANGFRKIAAYVKRINPETESFYVTTNTFRSLRTSIKGTSGSKGELGHTEIDEIAHGLRGADLVGFSSMTGYSELTRKIINRVRELDPSTFILWGGIHPIIQPEDAITADVDAICTGEGEFAFQELYDRLQDGRNYRDLRNFWFKKGDHDEVRNDFLPLMTAEQMETLPFPQYGHGETIFERDHGWRPMGLNDYLNNDGLGYQTLWSIGCPFHCSFCGNTKFIANDPKYKKIRHPSARYVVDEVKKVRERFPHISQVSFNDDSFMAITYRELETFAELWKAELDLPFAVYGVIPNYVKQDKFEILTWAGMNRVRMGIQSGSQAILDFYKRPTPPERVLEAAKVAAAFAPKYHIAPAYDIIMDNPIETRQDVIDTLELIYKMARPYTLLVYSLKVIPNTELERVMRERGIDLDDISANYMSVPPRAANLIVYLMASWHPPRWLFDRLLTRVEASTTPQPLYPRLGQALRLMYIIRRGLRHLRLMDFSTINGKSGYAFWRLGVVTLWRKRFTPRWPRPVREVKPSATAGPDGKRRVLIPVVEDVG